MLVNLTEIEKDEILVRQLTVANLEVETVSGLIEVHDLEAECKFRRDPQGYLMSCNLTAKAETACARCGDGLQMDLSFSDLFALRQKQPTEHHLVLDDSEMNVLFLEDTQVDLIRVLKEVIELETPAYPRHADGVATCVLPQQEQTVDTEKSPFGSLSKLLGD